MKQIFHFDGVHAHDHQASCCDRFPADVKLSLATRIEASRFAAVAEALANAGAEVVGAPYADDFAAHVRGELAEADGVLVWMNPIVDGCDRSVLNRVLSEVAAQGCL